jgi:hypothetical protein
VSRAVAVLILGLAASGEALPETDAPPLSLVWLDPTGVAATVEETARAEASRLLARLGASVHWRRGTPGEVIEAGIVHVVLLGLAGYRDTEAPLVLGATSTRPRSAPVLWVRVPAVRAALGVPKDRPLILLSGVDRLALGTAIGRVVAHEVVHTLVPSLPHGRGLMSSSLSRRELIGAPLPVDPEATLAFRAALRGEPTLPHSRPGIVAYGPEAVR